MLHFHVEEMTCGHCVTAISNAVQSVDADAKVEADLTWKTVAVRSKLVPGQVAAAIADAGYEAQLIQPAD